MVVMLVAIYVVDFRQIVRVWNECQCNLSMYLAALWTVVNVDHESMVVVVLQCLWHDANVTTL